VERVVDGIFLGMVVVVFVFFPLSRWILVLDQQLLLVKVAVRKK
jgi:hypothetical protein